MNEFVGEERKKGKNELINKQINNSFIIKSVSLPQNEDVNKLLTELRVIAARDDWSFSKLVLVALKEYVAHHPLPNPQSQIDRLLTVQMPHKPITQCCVQGCHGKSKFLLTLRNKQGKNEQFQVCRSHKRWIHADFTFLVSYREIPS